MLAPNLSQNQAKCRATRALDVEAADHGYGSETVGGEDGGRGRGGDLFIDRGQRQLDVNDGHRSGDDDDVLRNLREALGDGADGVFAERHGVELKFAIDVGGGALAPVRGFGFERHSGVLNGTMMRIVHNTANSSVDVGKGGVGNKNKGGY